jgi:hypothetical protein
LGQKQYRYALLSRTEGIIEAVQTVVQKNAITIFKRKGGTITKSRLLKQGNDIKHN